MLLDGERRDELLAALARLGERDRTVLALRYLLELPEREIAAVLACRPGTVKSRLSRATERLRGRSSDEPRRCCTRSSARCAARRGPRRQTSRGGSTSVPGARAPCGPRAYGRRAATPRGPWGALRTAVAIGAALVIAVAAVPPARSAVLDLLGLTGGESDRAGARAAPLRGAERFALGEPSTLDAARRAGRFPDPRAGTPRKAARLPVARRSPAAWSRSPTAARPSSRSSAAARRPTSASSPVPARACARSTSTAHAATSSAAPRRGAVHATATAGRRGPARCSTAPPC